MNSLNVKGKCYDSLINGLELYIMDVVRVRKEVHLMIVKGGDNGETRVKDLPKTSI